MITIRLDFARRLFVVCGDHSPVVGFVKYAKARDLLVDLRSKP